jgi:1-acyl-sn-glycerol-3-phosphate acyltransferase
MSIFLHPKKQFQKQARRFVSATMRLFVFFMHIVGILNLETGDRNTFRHLSSKIVAANHPSLLDVVMLIALIPNADCIVNAELAHSIVKGIIQRLYIFNSLDFEDLVKVCTESLKQGNCIIIFPEGSRTPYSGHKPLKRGAARISLSSVCGIVPVHIGGSLKYGLGKHDPWLAFNHQDKYIYRLSMGGEISPGKYRDLSIPGAARALTREIENFIFTST